MFGAAGGIDAGEQREVQVAGVDCAAFGDSCSFAEFSFRGAIENKNAARTFEFCLARAGSEILSVFVVFEMAGAAIAVTVPIAVAAAADYFFSVESGNAVAEPFGRGGRFRPAVQFRGKFSGEGAGFEFCIFDCRRCGRNFGGLRESSGFQFGAERDETGFAAHMLGDQEEDSGCNHRDGEYLAWPIVVVFHYRSPLRENYFSRISIK